MNSRRVLVVVAVSAVVLLSSCAGSGVLEESESVEMFDSARIADVTTATIPPAAELLTPADAERISGLSGLVVVPHDPLTGMDGDVNIATDSGQPVVMLVVVDREVWEQWLTDGITAAEPVSPPVGDESFIGPHPDVSSTRYIFGFRKGDVGIAINTFFVGESTDPMLSTEDLHALAEIVGGRL